MLKQKFILAFALALLTTTAQADNHNTMLQMNTSMGSIEIELFAEQAPLSTANFLEYVNSGFFDGLIFHRVIPGFMIQGGGMDANMREKPNKAPIQNEADNGLRNDRGTLAMARTSNPHSATSQFFINLVNNNFLNHSSKDARGWGYAVFGKVTKGMDVVDAIAQVSTGNSGYHQDVPKQPIVIESVELLTSATPKL